MVNRTKIAKKVSIITIISNSILSILKVTAGIVGNSSAIVADGLHSLSDVFTTVIAYIGIKIADKKPDESHPYGHEKFEAVLSKILAIFLFVTAAGIIYSAILNLQEGSFEKPSNIALAAAIVSIVVKEWMFRYTIRSAELINSSALKADAWHHRTDSFSSIGSLIGVIGAQNGYYFFEPLAAIFIGLFIVKVAFDIYLQSVRELTDASADEETIGEIRKLAMEVEGVKRIDLLMTRVHGSFIFVDIEIAVDGNVILYDAHEIAERVHDDLEEKIKKIKHCMVHVNPYE